MKKSIAQTFLNVFKRPKTVYYIVVFPLLSFGSAREHDTSPELIIVRGF